MNKGTAVPSYRQRIGYQAGLLGGIALLASALLSIGDVRTRSDIAARQAEDLQASLSQVVPEEIHDNRLLDDTLTATLPDGSPVLVYQARQGDQVAAVAFQVTGYGYAGAIQIVMGINREGEILGVRVVSHAETPGLGDKIEEAKSDWITKFTGLSLLNTPEKNWAVKKDGGQFDQFSGATITPRGVVKAVKMGMDFFKANQGKLLAVAVHETAEPAAQ